MKKNICKIVLITVLISAVLVSAAACSTRVDDSRNVVKPDIKAALDNYEQLDTKRSQFDAKLSMKLYGSKPNDSSTPITYIIGQQVFLDRILNGDSTYIDGKLNSYNVSEQVTSLISLLSKIPGLNIDAASINNISAYLQGNTYFTANMGHKEGTYNIKSAYNDGSGIPEIYWAATNDDSINAFISNNNVNLEIKLADYLMFSTYLDLSKAANFIKADSASKFFSTDTNLFYYNIVANTDELYKMIFDEIAKIAGLFDSEQYLSQIQLYEKVLPYLKKWISVKKATVDASVNKDNYPTQMKTSLEISVDFSVNDLYDVVNILISDEDERDSVKAMITGVNVFLKDRNGTKSGAFSIDFQLILEENFLYGGEDCSLEEVDADLFLPTTTENAERDVYLVAKASPEQELDGNNGIKISDGENQSGDNEEPSGDNEESSGG